MMTITHQSTYHCPLKCRLNDFEILNPNHHAWLPLLHSNLKIISILHSIDREPKRASTVEYNDPPFLACRFSPTMVNIKTISTSLY